MKFGIFSNGLRGKTIAADTYDADLREIETADRTGFDEAWVSEHIGGPLPDVVPFSELLIAKAAGRTERIRLGTAVRLLPLFHPLDVATSAAMCDHLLRGRYIFGFGSGVPFLRNMEQRGMRNETRHAMVVESIDFIQRCWTAAEPFDWDGLFWRGTGISMRPKPYQQPHPPMAVATSQDEMVAMAGERGWTLMIGQFDAPDAIGARADRYLAAALAAGVTGDRNRITVARHIHVAESVGAARSDLRLGAEFAIEQWKKMNPERFRGFLPATGTVDDITYDHAFDSGLFIAGDPDTVYRAIKEQFDAAGGFGTLLVVLGKDWATDDARDRSLELFMRHVAPRLAALDANAAPHRAARAAVAIDAVTATAAAY
jgi:alkanesulfonate monooxygenase SsuD/methylene tetrahydromethanopterin reductase-like flavin-dependent oxidoreductase (luciferase family)